MPAKSKAQQAAAGIAHAVEKGDLPQSKLKGASKRMFQSMRGTGSLKKFAKTKHKGLPSKVSEGAEDAINAKVQQFISKKQKMPGQMGDEWLQSTMQEIEDLAQGRSDPEIQQYYPGWQPADFQKLYNRVMMHFYGGGASEALSARQMFERERLTEGRDDAPKLGLGKAGLAYARMTSKDVMDQPGGTAKRVQKRYNMAKEVTNQKTLTGGKPQSKIFPSMDKVGPVKKAWKESKPTAQQVVDRLLD